MASWTCPVGFKALGGNNLGQGYFAPLSHGIKEVVHVPAMVTGGIALPEMPEFLVREGKAHPLGIGPPLLADLEWPFPSHIVLAARHPRRASSA